MPLEKLDGKSRLESYTFPYDQSKCDPLVSNNFGDVRRNKDGIPVRSHGGVDIYPSKGKHDYLAGVEVYPVTNGTVIEVSDGFLKGEKESGGTFSVDAIAVQNDDGSVMRYCELDAKVQVGDRVTQGETVVGVTSHMRAQTMLHIEIYTGEGKGPLSVPNNTTNPYVDDRKTNGLPYGRRSDLVDPSMIGTLAPINPDR